MDRGGCCAFGTDGGGVRGNQTTVSTVSVMNQASSATAQAMTAEVTETIAVSTTTPRFDSTETTRGAFDFVHHRGTLNTKAIGQTDSSATTTIVTGGTVYRHIASGGIR